MSAHKLLKQKWWALGVLVFLTLLISILLTEQAKAPGTTITLGKHTFTVTIADTPTLRAQGLSGTSNLPKDHGMLFTFQQPEVACFWMKDMDYNLDILWFDASNKLVKVEHNLSPATYPTSYCPDQPITHVLELNAGVVDSLNIQTGDTITLPKQ